MERGTDARFEERETILRLLVELAREWADRPDRVEAVRHIFLLVRGGEHKAKATLRAIRVRRGLRELAVAEGERMARLIFDKRGNHTEAHPSETELAASLGAAFERGFERGAASEVDSTGAPDGVIDAATASSGQGRAGDEYGTPK